MTRSPKKDWILAMLACEVGCCSILLEICSWEFLNIQLTYKGVKDFHICSCCDGRIEEDGTNYAPPEHPTPNTNLLWMKRFFIYHGVFTCPNTGILRINISRQVKRRLVREPSVVQNARIFLKTAAPCRNNSAHYRHFPVHFSHNERTPVQISLQYLHWC